MKRHFFLQVALLLILFIGWISLGSHQATPDKKVTNQFFTHYLPNAKDSLKNSPTSQKDLSKVTQSTSQK